MLIERLGNSIRLRRKIKGLFWGLGFLPRTWNNGMVVFLARRDPRSASILEWWWMNIFSGSFIFISSLSSWISHFPRTPACRQAGIIPSLHYSIIPIAERSGAKFCIYNTYVFSLSKEGINYAFYSLMLLQFLIIVKPQQGITSLHKWAAFFVIFRSSGFLSR